LRGNVGPSVAGHGEHRRVVEGTQNGDVEAGGLEDHPLRGMIAILPAASRIDRDVSERSAPEVRAPDGFAPPFDLPLGASHRALVLNGDTTDRVGSVCALMPIIGNTRFR